VTALILAALMIHGIVPGPQLLRTNPEMLYACVAGLLMSTVFLLIIGWPIAKVMARIVTLNRSAVTVIVLVLILVGVFSLNQDMFDVQVLLVFGMVGYYMRRYGYSVAAAGLANILGRGLESNLRSGLQLTENNPIEFVTRPATFVIMMVILTIFVIGIRQARKGRKTVKAKAVNPA
jgi:putative tricarboxylic transport membrane protein